MRLEDKPQDRLRDLPYVFGRVLKCVKNQRRVSLILLVGYAYSL